MPSPTAIISGLLLATVIYLLLTKLLRSGSTRNPLPPGPTPWPIVGNLPHLGAIPHHSIAALARKYGPLMYLRLGFVDVVVAASASVAAQFLKVHDANFADRPPTSGGKYIAYNYHDMVFAPYGPRWRLLRKVSAVHLFSGKALDDFRNVRQVSYERFCYFYSRGFSNAMEICWLLRANALGKVLVGKRVFGDITGGADPKADEFKSMVVELMVLAGVFNIGDFVPALEWLDLQGVASKMKKLHLRFDSFLSQLLEEHGKTAHDVSSRGHVDFLSTLIGLTVEDGPDGEGGVNYLMQNMFTAGTDTSSSTVEWAIAELIRSPKIMAQLQSELDSVVGRDRLVTELDLPKLPYLQAVIKETFRLHPSTPLSLPRIAAESCEINGRHIPKGATLLVNVWAIARDPDVWSDPLRFDPERFLPGGEKPGVDVKGSDFELIPFGAGRRICAGLSLGLRMVQLMTASLVHAFDWELADGLKPGNLNMDEAYGLTLQRAEPLNVKPMPRLSAQVYGS
ncbi:Flavonoid 3'-monooxygenase [Linum perenne]